MFGFSRWQLAAILEFQVRIAFNVKNNNSNGFIMFTLVEIDTLYVSVADILPEI